MTHSVLLQNQPRESSNDDLTLSTVLGHQNRNSWQGVNGTLGVWHWWVEKLFKRKDLELSLQSVYGVLRVQALQPAAGVWTPAVLLSPWAALDKSLDHLYWGVSPWEWVRHSGHHAGKVPCRASPGNCESRLHNQASLEFLLRAQSPGRKATSHSLTRGCPGRLDSAELFALKIETPFSLPKRHLKKQV